MLPFLPADPERYDDSLRNPSDTWHQFIRTSNDPSLKDKVNVRLIFDAREDNGQNLVFLPGLAFHQSDNDTPVCVFADPRHGSVRLSEITQSFEIEAEALTHLLGSTKGSLKRFEKALAGSLMRECEVEINIQQLPSGQVDFRVTFLTQNNYTGEDEWHLRLNLQVDKCDVEEFLEVKGELATS